MLYGIDVSKWNPKVNWGLFSLDFAFIRASYGCTPPNHQDKMFKKNWEGASKTIRGAYHFLRAPQPGKDQAKVFLDMVNDAGGLMEGDLSPMLDIEDSQGASPSKILKCCEDWLTVVEQETGRRPIIYTGPAFWNGYNLGGMFKNYHLCVSDYRPLLEPQVPVGWSNWTFWQYTDKGTVVGVEGNVDRIKFKFDEDELAKLRTTDTPGLSHTTYAKAVRYVQRAVKFMPRVGG
jgi:lysozyme